MSVTRTGVEGERPGREATPGSSGGRPDDGRRRRRRGRGERLMVPDADFTSYYGRPVIKAPIWREADIAGYLFLGGLAGASSVLAAGADVVGLRHAARASKIGAAAGISGSLALLSHDLGRPERFHHMLRVFKVTSPMSVGTYFLSGFAPAALAAAASDLTRRLPGVGRIATATAAAVAPAVASYTAVLLADTAVPAWHEAHRELPYVFVGSATCAAAGWVLVAAPTAETGPARRAAVLGLAVETLATRRMTSRLGLVAEAYETGRAGVLMRTAELLTAGGATAGALLGRRSRAAAMVAGAALLTGSALTRFAVFEAGQASARDPRYTVVPQRERVDAGASPAPE